MADLDWQNNAACKGTDTEAMFVDGAAQHPAAVICRTCYVRPECAAYALDTRQEYGVWGGMTVRERRALLKSHPEIASWRDLFTERGTGADQATQP